MLTCQTCHSQLPDSSRFCLACGSPATHPDAEATVLIEAASAPSSITSFPKSGRFQTGTILAGRYQVVGLLGRGGMGEVYRANDLTLDQPVALKFLPQEMALNPAMLGRFHGEVRIARQVSHPNVCRVYDIGQVDS